MKEVIEFRRDLESLLNKHSREKGSDTPDFVLATYLLGCLTTFDVAVKSRDQWYGVSHGPGKGMEPGSYSGLEGSSESDPSTLRS